MKYLILIIMLVLLIGCTKPNQYTAKATSKDWCMAQDDFVFINGHTTDLTNEVTGEVIEDCCCANGRYVNEFACICNDKRELQDFAFGGLE